jgi:leucyl aminopeptidase
MLFLFFYSGGYNIKTGPGCSIELMKFDMGGSAATFGAAKAIAQIKPPGVEVTIFPAKVVV